MLQSIVRHNRLFLYIILLIILSTINNIRLNNLNIFKLNIKTIKVEGLSVENNKEINKNLDYLLYQNLFFINKDFLINLLNEHNLIHSFSIKKNYPDALEVKIKKTEFIAITHFEDKKFLIGANGKLIDYIDHKIKLPYVFGNIDIKEFILFIDTVDASQFNSKNLKEVYFFPSGRWDIKNEKGVIFKLPKDNLNDALNLSQKIFNTKKFTANSIIDLRISGQIILIDG